MPAFEWVHVLLRQQKMTISLSPADFCNSAKIRTERGKTDQKHNDAYSRWLIEQADRKEKEEFSRSFSRLKCILLNIVVFGIISLGVCLAVQQVTH